MYVKRVTKWIWVELGALQGDTFDGTNALEKKEKRAAAPPKRVNHKYTPFRNKLRAPEPARQPLVRRGANTGARGDSSIVRGLGRMQMKTWRRTRQRCQI